ncbi:hypothetical protein GCM10018782_43030 [Streptomyces griseoaurantiacus]|nr:hypothetical protein GCM10018782_43030 [Streptomyces griseoaurantiacus]
MGATPVADACPLSGRQELGATLGSRSGSVKRPYGIGSRGVGKGKKPVRPYNGRTCVASFREEGGIGVRLRRVHPCHLRFRRP